MTVSQSTEETVYILITQCMQNNFFLSEENRLRMPEDQALQMLLQGDIEEIKSKVKLDAQKTADEKNKRIIVDKDALKAGPLYQFLQATVGTKNRRNHLHVIHIRDWHEPSVSYDFERRRYGSHCEAGSWEAEPIVGFDAFLQPWKNEVGGAAQAQSVQGYTPENDPNTTFYEYLSDSLFDFRPNEDEDKSLLVQILDNLLVDGDGRLKRVYVVVIGVLTDIKIKLLLVGLRSNYEFENLIISDVLTASSTLERHLSGLDFADKVLNVEIIHSLNALASVLHPQHADNIPNETIKNRPDFRDYRSYYLDKQNVLAYQDQQLLKYIELTGQRGAEVYGHIFGTNKWLTRFGFLFLLATFVMGIAKFVANDRFPLEVIVVTGGLSLTQLLTVFFSRPLGQIQKNLNNLVRLRNYLETYSTVTALLRHHLTSPERLQTDDLENLKEQLMIVQDVAREMSANFQDIELGAPKGNEGDEDTVLEAHTSGR